MLNFDEGDQVRLYLNKDAAASTDIDAGRFVKAVRNLDLGRRYQDHLTDLLDTDLTRQMQIRQDKAAFAAEISLAKLHGHIDSHGQSLGEAALAGAFSLPRPDGSLQALECCFLTLLDCPLNGLLLIRMRPQANKEVCLLYLPGHPTKALRQYPSLAALGQAMTQMLWHDEHPDAPAPVLEIVDRITDRCDTVLYSGASKSAGPVSSHDIGEILPILQKLDRK